MESYSLGVSLGPAYGATEESKDSTMKPEAITDHFEEDPEDSITEEIGDVPDKTDKLSLVSSKWLEEGWATREGSCIVTTGRLNVGKLLSSNVSS